MPDNAIGMAVAPHGRAARVAADILAEGGNAIEAMVAAAAAIAVCYPHMSGLGGDAFWLIHEPGRPVIAIDGSGGAAAALEGFCQQRALTAIPVRGPLAANTVAGALGSWSLALDVSHRRWHGTLPLSRLLEEAIFDATQGITVTESQSRSTRGKYAELSVQPGFSRQFLIDGRPPEAGRRLKQPALAATLRRLAQHGLDDFYRGALAQSMAADLAASGSPLKRADLAGFRAQWRRPLSLAHSHGVLYNVPPPTQGLVSLMILGILDRLGLEQLPAESADYVHLVVEATKQAFRTRDLRLRDLTHRTPDVRDCLSAGFLAARAAEISPTRAAPWRGQTAPGDTVWMGVIDRQGRAVSFIQSLYHEFGSGLVLNDTGIVWQNRGTSFSLRPGAPNAPAPGRKPFHTLNPALARLHGGQVMVYGSMGGDGQPQTQAALFTRMVVYGQTPEQALAAPRWLLGRTWGTPSDTLKLEGRFEADVITALEARGHEIELLPAFDEATGHGGAIVLDSQGVLSGASDPRSDGAVCGLHP